MINQVITNIQSDLVGILDENQMKLLSESKFVSVLMGVNNRQFFVPNLVHIYFCTLTEQMFYSYNGYVPTHMRTKNLKSIVKECCQ